MSVSVCVCVCVCVCYVCVCILCVRACMCVHMCTGFYLRGTFCNNVLCTCTIYIHDCVACVKPWCACILGMHMRSGPRAESKHLRCGRPSCARACQLTTFLIQFLITTDMYVRTYAHHENRSLIQSLVLMCWVISE